MESMRSPFYCYRCNRFIQIHIRSPDSVSYPDCKLGFVEEIDTPSRSPIYHRFPAAALYSNTSPSPGPSPGLSPSPRFRRAKRNARDCSPFNPVIVLHGSNSGNEGVVAERGNNFELYYDDGSGSGLRPLPASMSEFLMGSGFDRLQLVQLEINGVGRFEQPPASHDPRTPLIDQKQIMNGKKKKKKKPFKEI